MHAKEKGAVYTEMETRIGKKKRGLNCGKED